MAIKFGDKTRKGRFGKHKIGEVIDTDTKSYSSPTWKNVSKAIATTWK